MLGSRFVDLLVGPHGVDRYLELVKPTWTVTEARAEVTEVRRTTPDSVTLALRANSAWRGHLPGQFVQVGVEIDGVRRTRCYSPAGVAGRRRELELTVKTHPEGLVSRYLRARARPGMVVSLSEPQGDFLLPEHRPDRVLLVSGGSGITPVISMLRTLCAEGHSGEVTFLHYAPDPERALYREELERLASAHPKLSLIRSYTRASEGELRGHFSPEHLRAAAPDFVRAEAFACGPPPLLDAVREIWAQERIERRLHVESFLPPSLGPASGVPEGRIDFAASGARVGNTGASLLEQAEAAGLSPDYGCRMGICHSCTCRKSAGTVRNLATGETSSAEEEDIQICVSAPVGDVTIEL
jgi:stearoyl-CoA 9-desaturase NADPH oxidoreductase